MESCVAPRLLYGLQACFPSKQQMKKIEACWHQLLRSMVRGGWKRVSNDPENPNFRYVLTNKSIERILKCNKTIRGIAISHHMRYFGHVARMRNTSLTKKMMFADPQRLRYSDPWKNIADMVGVDRDQILRDSPNRSKFRCNRHFFPPSKLSPGGKKCLGFSFPRGKNCLILGTFFPRGKNQRGEESACEGVHICLVSSPEEKSAL